MKTSFIPEKLISGVPADTLTTVGGRAIGVAVAGAVAVVVIAVAGRVFPTETEVTGVADAVPVAPGVFE